jgi:CBS domain-containing protein
MINTLSPAKARNLTLRAASAAELMTPNPVSIHETATVKEALVLLIDKRIHAAPVIDDAGHPKGVLSGSDILVHDREKVTHLLRVPDYYKDSDLTFDSGEKLPSGFQVEEVDRTLVRDLMTPTVFSVPLDAPAGRVVNDMLELNVHRLFVVDRTGVLVGVITAFDVLRALREV